MGVNMKLIKKTIRLFCVFCVMGLFVVLGLYLYAYFSPTLDIKNANQFYIYDDQEQLIYQGSGNNEWVALEDISPELINAVLSTEDKNFYKHHGFDYLRIIKAMYLNLKSGSIVQGASTISQQYIKNMYLDFDKTWERKIEEAFLTLRLEVHYSKDEILEGYLNTINFGQGNYGIENASQYYFNKSAKDLTMEESIILAGIPKAPSKYNPVTNYDASINRAKVIAIVMLNNETIDQDTYDKLFISDIEIYGKKSENNLNMLMYYQDAVYNELNNLESIPDSLIESGGIKIYTSLNLEAQTIMEESIMKNMTKDDMQVSSIIINPNTGGVMALTGGIDYSKSQYNRAISSKRQVGSSMKPFLYYAALENGMVSSSTFLSEPTTFMFSNNQSYSPANYNDKYANKSITMAAALAYSDNIYAVKTHLFLGEEILVNTAKRMGIRGDLEPVPSLALGTSELSMLDFARGYTTLASGGYKRDITFINRIEDMNGNVLYKKNNNDELVLNESYTYILNEIMTSTYNSAFIDYNSPTIISLASKISSKYAMKTGSTGTDCWMVGYDSNVLMLTWNGYDDNREMEVKDGSISKNIWVDTVENLSIEKKWYEIPSNVIGVPLDAVTGMESKDNKKTTIFYYVNGSEYNNQDTEFVFKEKDN
ncbi:MAG: penicillin-binding protein [Firmicutes bacterium]|nr:penicillin-binding protein [Bacillota bacterium]